MIKKTIFHIDVNSAFLSWEAAYRIHHLGGSLDLRLIPSAIGGSTEMRHGIILAKSTPAKKYGITTGMTTVEAMQKCPGLYLAASKFAVNGTTISLARELGPKGIRVNAVAPGITETDMMKAVPKNVIEPMIAQIPLRRLGQPEDIANAFVFLASDEASYITGVVLSVDGMARA